MFCLWFYKIIVFGLGVFMNNSKTLFKRLFCTLYKEEIKMLLKKKMTLFVLSLSTLVMTVEAANASVLTANYTTGEVVTDFNNYDFGGGILLIKAPDPSTFGIGSIINGYYQTYVNNHQKDLSGVSNPLLNSEGAGAGYELTMMTHFSASITEASLSGGFGFKIESGSASLYLDETPDYNFSSDTGFSDGVSLLTSTEATGNGYISSYGFGVVNVDFLSFSNVNSDVYGSTSIGEATALFALTANTPTQTTDITSVAGSSVLPDDYLFSVDGNLQLSQMNDVIATPLPLSVWLFGSALISLISFSRRKEPLV